jgi:hypothetical protein
MSEPEAASPAAVESATEVQQVASTAATEVQQAVVGALAKEHDVPNFGGPTFWGQRHGKTGV